METEDLPPTQYLILEILAARARLGETVWPFPNRLAPAVHALAEAGLVGEMSGNVPGYLRAWLTDAGRTATLSATYTMPALREYQDLLAAIYLYIPWQFVTKQLTTPQKDMFADALDAWRDRATAADGQDYGKADRWWRPDA